MKRCKQCGEIKSLDDFHRQSGMKDGHLNKCAACVVQYVAAWMKNKGVEAAAYRRKIYAKRIETGKAFRKRVVKIDGVSVGQDPERRRMASRNYQQKRHALVSKPLDELSEFVFKEAMGLCALRQQVTKFKWSIDHIVPIRHKDACGLHVAANFQVVPHAWNCRKSNKTMLQFFAA